MPTILVKNRSIHYQEINRGGGPTILMIHGMLSNLSVYYFHIAPLLGRHFHVVVFDLKSHGFSDRALDGYDLDSMSGEVVELMEALSVRSAYLVGYSYGALISLKMASRFPDKVRKLAVIEGPDPSDGEPLAKMAAYSKEGLLHYITNYGDAAARRMGRRQVERHHRLYEFLFKETTMQEDMYREREFFYGEELSSIRQDTLLIYGKESECLAAGYRLDSLLPNSSLVMMRGDHNLPVQAPGDISRELMEFMREPVFAK